MAQSPVTAHPGPPLLVHQSRVPTTTASGLESADGCIEQQPQVCRKTASCHFSVRTVTSTIPLQTQEALVQVPWGVDVLALPGCNARVDKSAHLIFSGPRVRMGEQPALVLATRQPERPASLSVVQIVPGRFVRHWYAQHHSWRYQCRTNLPC